MIHSVNPYLIFEGNGKEAALFYEEVLGAERIGMQMMSELPQSEYGPFCDGEDQLLHAHLRIGQTDLMLTDGQPGERLAVGNNVTVAVAADDREEARQLFDRLAEGGEELMALQETFFSPAYGQVTDRYGVTWHVSTHAQKEESIDEVNL
ncbi:hypothetical protein CEY16_07080 [Halalkalibacillus sediminis]|uniref:PhnB-like domain-containing protein n=1 Tax=Halalkalibacillus sediminis TaxID=2018042 RepID=A0A2I0QTQ0_9BACI|nr:VOC family protein [Halalkalibacillus sediminis]PKR77689.1 hypothetical protein CEY16_07080 [Halalkalibacillus sediminis]